jgi:hypothetical protein
MPLTRKESFRQIAQQRQAELTKFEAFVRNELEQQFPSISVDDIDTITNALRFADANQTCSNILQEDLPKLFVDFNMPIGGHDLRKKITDRKIKLESTTPVSLQLIGELYLEVSREREAAKPNFMSLLSKAKNLVKVKKRKNKTKMDLAEMVEEKPEQVVAQRASDSSDVCENELARETLDAMEHTYSIAERVSFADWINKQLANDTLSKPYLPIDPNCEADMFEKLADGIVFCRMLHLVSPELINQRAINKNIKHQFHKIENLNLVLNTATSIGCVVVNQDVTGLLDEVPYLQLGLLWQIIRSGLFCDIEIKKNPEIFDALRSLLQDGENMVKLQAMAPEEILLRWVNYHLEANENYKGEPITNFGHDIKNSVAYQHLLEQLLKHDGVKNDVKLNCYSDKNYISRATITLKLADKLGCRAFVTEKDIVGGNVKLNTAFVANLFNKKMHLKPPPKADDADAELADEDDEMYIETAEEKTYRHFINSLDIKPQIMYLYEDLRDGVAILKLEDRIKPGVVEWKRRVNFPPFKTPFQGGENCVYALEIADDKIKVNIGRGQVRGHDINVGKPKILTLGLVWQLMRAYTLSLLARLSNQDKLLDDRDVLAWVNDCTGLALKSFKDPKLRDGDAIRTCLLTIDPAAEIEERVTGSHDLLENASCI